MQIQVLKWKLFGNKTNETDLSKYPNCLFKKKLVYWIRTLGYMKETTDPKTVVYEDYEQK
ncbi:MAG TPA: hypothetical protein VD815_06915 [Candidatus Saccharimonadales bacterium]|nr:hypothetical protein [Candidatus Saccharimonadales bacterium]